MNTYYQVTAINKATGDTEIMYGSFEKKDCKDEIECERDNWKSEGYKTFKIETVEVEDAPNPELYKTITADQLWLAQAASFNFELNKEELVSYGLEVGFITQPDSSKDLYIINTDY